MHQIYESFLEYTSKIYIQRVDEARYTHALRLVIWISTEDYGRGGRQKVTGYKWKNSLDIISNFFETRGRYARLARSLTHVRRGVTVKHLAPAGAGYVTWIFVSNKICRFASAIWRTSRCAYVTLLSFARDGIDQFVNRDKINVIEYWWDICGRFIIVAQLNLYQVRYLYMKLTDVFDTWRIENNFFFN